jgi:ribulose-phosphate 3-epimerase
MRMAVLISPSLLAADLACLGDEISRAVEGGCDSFHVDIMDFHFVPNLSFGPGLVETVRRLTKLPIDVHLMVTNPLDMIGPFASAGSDSITVHVEALSDIPAALDAIGALGIRKGLSFRPDTPVEAVISHIERTDIILVMSVFPGFGGQKFLESSYERIRRISSAGCRLSSPPVISVDGGVDYRNAPLLVKAGATCLVAGNSIFRNHGAAANVRRMREALGGETQAVV